MSNLKDFSSFLKCYNKSLVVQLVNPYLLYVGIELYLSKQDILNILHACPSGVDYTISTNVSTNTLLFTFFIEYCEQ